MSSVEGHRAANSKHLPPLIQPDDFPTTIWHSPLSPNTPLDTMPTAELSLKRIGHKQFGFEPEMLLQQLDDAMADEANDVDDDDDDEEDTEFDLLGLGLTKNKATNTTPTSSSHIIESSCEDDGAASEASRRQGMLNLNKTLKSNKHIAILSGENNHDMLILFLTE